MEQLRKSLQTGNENYFYDLSLGFKADRNRIHKEISRQYRALFAVIQSVRKSCILGIQYADSVVSENEKGLGDCQKRYEAMNSLMIKYIEVFDEIICLLENGFPDGAMQRWRTFYEYSVIILFILEQGEEAAEAYINQFLRAIQEDFRPKSNFAWAKAAKCLREEKQIHIKKLLNHVKGIEPTYKIFCEGLYKFTSQAIHGSSFGVHLSINDEISKEINDLYTKNAEYFAGGVSTVISNTMILLNSTFRTYFRIFSDGDSEMYKLFMELFKEYVKVYYKCFAEDVSIKIGVNLHK